MFVKYIWHLHVNQQSCVGYFKKKIIFNYFVFRFYFLPLHLFDEEVVFLFFFSF